MVFTLRNRHSIAVVPRQKGCHHNAWQPQDTDGYPSEVLNCWIWNHLLTVQITSINSQIKIWIKDMPQQDVHLNVYTYIYTLQVLFCIYVYICIHNMISSIKLLHVTEVLPIPMFSIPISQLLALPKAPESKPHGMHKGSVEMIWCSTRPSIINFPENNSMILRLPLEMFFPFTVITTAGIDCGIFLNFLAAFRKKANDRKVIVMQVRLCILFHFRCSVLSHETQRIRTSNNL